MYRVFLHKAKFIPSIWVSCLVYLLIGEFVFMHSLGFSKMCAEVHVAKQAYW